MLPIRNNSMLQNHVDHLIWNMVGGHDLVERAIGAYRMGLIALVNGNSLSH